MKRSVVLCALSALLATCGSARAVTVRDFLGTNQAGGNFTNLAELGLGWDREHFYDQGWPLEAGSGYDFSVSDKEILAAQKEGVAVLPILAYVAPWAAQTHSCDFDYKGIHYRVLVTKDPNSPGGYRRVRIGTDSTGKEVSRQVMSNERSSPQRELWEEYVERLVSHYSKPPYNVKYWQIWNEGTMESGCFWDENIENYVDNVHIPAAKIIRKYGGKVVWGGWPDCNPLSEYDKALACHDAWKYTDILDVHYLPPVAFDYLYKRWVGNGKCEGIWMTEIGFTQNFNQIANTYPRMFYWALTHKFDDPEKYKVFWFARWSPDDPKAYGYNCSLMKGQTPTDHGLQIHQFSELLRGQKVEAFTQYSTDLNIGFSLDERAARPRSKVSMLTTGTSLHSIFRSPRPGTG